MTKQKDVNNQPKSPLRRKTIKTLAVGVGALAGSTVLPEKWVTPIIQGIVLPAHAQTSAFQLAFCNGRVDLQLVSGHSGTSSVTIRATGCLNPAQANVTFTLTLAGYAQAVITENESSSEASILTAFSEALVPSAHAAASPLCSQQQSVTTAADGSFTADFTLGCGPGIVQVELTANIGGGATRAGWLDIAPCNPCSDESGAKQLSCEDYVRVDISAYASSLVLYKNDEALNVTIATYVAGDRIKVKNKTAITEYIMEEHINCDGVPVDGAEYTLGPLESTNEHVIDAEDAAKFEVIRFL